MITSDEQISPTSFVCEQNFLHLHFLCVGILSTLLPWEFISVKLRLFLISKRGLVVKFACVTETCIRAIASFMFQITPFALYIVFLFWVQNEM